MKKAVTDIGHISKYRYYKNTESDKNVTISYAQKYENFSRQNHLLFKIISEENLKFKKQTMWTQRKTETHTHTHKLNKELFLLKTLGFFNQVFKE